MKTKKIGLGYKERKIEIECKKCNILEKIRGLMFRKKEDAPILLFDFIEEKNISFHSFFVFFNFVIIWLDKNDKIIDYREVFPWNWRIKTKKNFSKVVEIPFNNKNLNVFERLNDILVDKRKI